MKRILLIVQVLIVSLIAAKMLLLTEGLHSSRGSAVLGLHHFGQANAETSDKPQTAAVRDVTDDGLTAERELLAALQKKKQDLDSREAAVRVEEEKIQGLKKEIMEKIVMLNALDTQLSAKLDTEKTSDAKRLKELAKVYESAPPQKAAAMLEKLETATAAGITINMKRERAGLIWGFLSPQKAVEITREITKKTKNPSD